jgi:hypothetical protein
MRSKADRLVTDYVRRLNAELRDQPRPRRRELVQEISEHIDEARVDVALDDEAAIRTILDRLGDPAEIAAEARERSAPNGRRPGALEVGALILLPIGGIIIPFLGWVVGVILLWASDAWNRRDKLIGTLVVPGGLLLPAYLALAASGGSGGCGATFDAAGRVIASDCQDSGGPELVDALRVTLMALLILAPLVTAAYLARRMRRRSAAPAA